MRKSDAKPVVVHQYCADDGNAAIKQTIPQGKFSRIGRQRIANGCTGLNSSGYGKYRSQPKTYTAVIPRAVSTHKQRA
jgi:hypothetical protein